MVFRQYFCKNALIRLLLSTYYLSKGGAVKLRELAELTGIPERQVRYLIAEGFIPPPRGGRAHASYGEDHAAAIRRYTRLRELGFPPAAIKVLLQSGEGAPFPVAPGITLVVDPALIGSGTESGPIATRLIELLNDLLKERNDAGDPADPD
jgi:MerR family copper efflux transcriptional regulator